MPRSSSADATLYAPGATQPSAQKGSPVRIEGLELLLTSMPFSAERRVLAEESIDEYNASSQAFTNMESLIVKVHDSEGRIGWGEAFGHTSNPVTWAALEGLVGPFCLGRSAEPQSFRRQAEYAFHAFGRTGPVHYAVSALDTALWDLTAQRAGMPLRHLLAEQLDTLAANEVTSYASLVHYGEDPAEVAHHIHRAQQAGFDSVKLHESSVPAVAAARQQVGDQADVMTDVNCRWDEAGADQAFRDFEPYNLLWLEEPIFPPDDTAALARLNAQHRRVAAGENASGGQGLCEQIRSGAVSFAQPSVGKIGGISAMLEVLQAGRQAQVAVAPHCFYYGPAVNATAEIIAVLAGEKSAGPQAQLEVPFVTWQQQLHPLHSPGPSLRLSEQPGLAFTPDGAVLHEHLIRAVQLG